jgi:hypothetical protein
VASTAQIIAWAPDSEQQPACSFGGYDLEAEEPYKTIVNAIEGAAKKALDEVYSKVYKD